MLGLASHAAPAHGVETYRNGTPAETQLTWYTSYGAALRDALRGIVENCRPTNGDIVVCKKRRSFRIDSRVLQAKRDSRKSGGSEYDAYRRSAAGH